MEIKIMYRYMREDGGITVSTEKPNCEYTETYRLIAEEGLALTKDGIEFCLCIDVDSADGWYEVEELQDNM